jgi:hypothetical protein
VPKTFAGVKLTFPVRYDVSALPLTPVKLLLSYYVKVKVEPSNRVAVKVVPLLVIFLILSKLL